MKERSLKKHPCWAVTDKDAATYRTLYNAPDIKTLPVFVPFEKVTGPEGLGTYCLYHGNLSVAENEKAATWLLEEVFSKLKVPFVIAGKKSFCPFAAAGAPAMPYLPGR